MTTLEATEFVARIMKLQVNDARLTGSVDIRLNASQGTICDVKLAVTEKKVTVFELGQAQKKVLDN